MASITAQSSRLVLTQNKPLRLLTLLLFYFTQGFPIGLFFYAVPSWMAANGATTGQVATVVAMAGLPWSLKLVNGFLIDRYTFLPMGRRRVWIIGAQSLIVVSLVVGALLAPVYSDVFMLSAIGFCANAAVTFQDVGIDSLAVDIMPEDERAKAGGIMGGAQLIGMSATTAAGGALLANHGITVCLLVGAVVPGLVMLYGIVIREREGERRLPWSAGQSNPGNLDVQVEAWAPLLKKAYQTIIVPMSLLLIVPLLVRSLPWGGFESFHPVMYQAVGGWSLTEYTNFNSTLILAAGVFAMSVGGFVVDRIGAQRAMIIAAFLGIIAMTLMGLARELWSQDWVLMGFMTAMEGLGAIYFVAMIPMCMRMCNPAVAATQFTIYMALGNFGRPLGASIAAVTVGAGSPQLFYWAMAALWAAALGVLMLIRFPSENRAEHITAHELPQGEGPSPRQD